MENEPVYYVTPVGYVSFGCFALSAKRLSVTVRFVNRIYIGRWFLVNRNRAHRKSGHAQWTLRLNKACAG